MSAAPRAIVAEPAFGPARPRTRSRRERLLKLAVPYSLLAPATLVIVAVLGYPLYYLVKLSFQHYGLTELIQHKGTWVGTDNYASILHDPVFWKVVLRTVLFTIANVGLTMVLGTLIAMLLARLGSFMRGLVSAGLVLAWSMPVVVAVQVWLWMTDTQSGVLNYVLTRLHVGDYTGHDWFDNPWQGLSVITALIVWGAIPFVAITVYAGLAQVPGELLEAASIDGARPWRAFRDVTFPILKPIFIILTSLSIIWDFQVFNQPYLLRFQRPEPDYYLMSIYAYERAYGGNYGLGASIALVMVLLMLAVTFFYIRQMVRIGEAA